MVTQVTHGIRISVESRYEPGQSRPDANHFFFSYHITIENTSDYTVRLLRRHWFIFDSCARRSEVEGEGVIGQQPFIAPGESYSYASACTLLSEYGCMHGTYLMQREMDNARFHVEIPRFELFALFRKN